LSINPFEDAAISACSARQWSRGVSARVEYPTKIIAKDNTMKRRIIRLAGVLALAAAPFSGHALAQTGTEAGAGAPFVTEQPAGELRVRVFLGQPVHTPTGETVGDINDVIFDHQGRISTIVIGVGGFLGMGEKNVGVSFETLTFKTGDNGIRTIVVPLGKEALAKAPDFKVSEKTSFEKAEDKAADWGHKAADKAVELKDQAVHKIEDMRKPEPPK
jgi:sporulation protein YlmC with PRC-barrel domain